MKRFEIQWWLTMHVLSMCIVVWVGARSATASDVARVEGEVPLKVILRKPSAIYQQPNQSAANRPVSAMEWFYVLNRDGVTEPGADGWYEISASHDRNDAVGFIRADAENVVEWVHRQALMFVEDSSRERVQFFASKEDLTTHFSDTGSASAISEEPAEVPRQHILPILSKHTMSVLDSATACFEVAYLHASGGGDVVQGQAAASLDISQSKIQVAFVLDTTMSMSPFIAATRDVIIRTSEELARQSGDGPIIEFACVAYRDHVSQPGRDWYVTNVVSDFTSDYQSFIAKMRQVAESRQSSEDPPEHGLAGLNLAMDQLSWDAGSFRHIVVCGDCSWHDTPSAEKNPEGYSLRAFLVKAQPTGYQRIPTALHALRVVSNIPSDHARTEQQFKQLAAGVNKEYSGAYASFDGQSEAAKFVDDVSRMVLASRRGLAQAQQGRQPAVDTPARGIVLRMLRASKGSGGGPEFAAGWCSEVDRQGRQCFVPTVLIEYQQLAVYSTALQFLVKSLEAARPTDADGIAEVVQKIQRFSTAASLGESLRQDQPLHEWLSQLLALPVTSGIFEISLDRIAAMTQADFESWVALLRQHHEIMRGLLVQPDLWFALAGNVPLERRQAFIRVSDLP